MSTRAARAFRGTVFAAIATVIAAAAHTIGGGAPPSPLFCAILFALAVPLATALASPRQALWRTTLAVGASQALFHGAFAVVGDLGAAPASTAPGHLHGAVAMPTADAAAVLSAAAAPHSGMTIAHLVAAVVTILLVHRGEAALAAIAAWMVRRAAVPLSGYAFPRVPRRVVSAPVRPRAMVVVPPGLGRRGPPSALSSLSAA